MSIYWKSKALKSLVQGLQRGLYPIFGALGWFSPDSVGFQIVRRFKVVPYKAYRDAIKRGTRRYNACFAAQGAKTKKALVFLLRGHWVGPTLMQYLVACALKKLGYQVTLVTCGSDVERCGVNQIDNPLGSAPLACGACEAITHEIALSGFQTVKLGEFRDGLSTRQVERAFQTVDVVTQPQVQQIEHFLIRFFRGDTRRVNQEDKETALHLNAASRYIARFDQLVQREQPDCICLFSGSLMPETLFLDRAKRRGIPALLTEAGCRHNTLFVSRDESANHYRSDQLWQTYLPRLTETEVESAKTFLSQRTQGPEDPYGRTRNVIDRDVNKYAELARTPYVLFFAPLTHDLVSMGKRSNVGDVFACIRALCNQAQQYQTKLVIKSHPDERNDINPTHFGVEAWMESEHLTPSEWVQILPPTDIWDPYQLASHAKTIVIYSGTLGLELAALDHHVFCLARLHYTDKGFTDDIDTDIARIFLSESKTRPPDAQTLALKYLYFYYFVSNIDIDCLLDEVAPKIHEVPADMVQNQQAHMQAAHLQERIAFLLDLKHL